MSTTHVERLQQELASITQPLVDHYAELEQTIKAMESEIISLRKARTQLRQTIRSINPELIPAYGSNGKKPGARAHKTVAQSRLDEMTEWLQAHKNELNANGGFHASGLEKAYDDLPARAATLSASLRILHADGIIRLDHTGNGGAKYFMVI